MPTPLLLSLGAWALGLLLSALAWWSPDGAWFPSPLAGFVLLLVALVLFLGGMLVAGLRLRAPKASTRSLFGAAAPFFAAAVAVTLAAHGLLPHPALPLVVTVAGGLWGRRLARGTGAPVRWPGELGFGAAVLVALLIGIPAILVGVGGQVLWQLAAPRYDVPAARLASTRSLEAYRPAPAPDVTAEEAGLALLAVAQTGDTAHSPLFVRVPGASARAWVPADDPFAGQGGDTVLARASRGLTPAERAWLAGVAAHPGFAAWATVARAPALDPWAGLKAPLPPDLSGVSLPLPSYVTLRAAARAQLYRVALAVAERRTARADSLARELVGFGLRLRDDADPLVTALVGNAVARDGGMALAAVWRAAGRTAAADSLQAAIALPDAPAAPLPAESLTPRALRGAVLRHAADTAAARGLRFESLSVLSVARCTDLRELLYGPAPAVRAAFDAAAPAFARSDAERGVFAVLARGEVGGFGAGGVPPLFRVAALALGRERMRGCFALLSGAVY